MEAAHRQHIPPEASPYAKHIPALDGLRGFAVMGVMASHLFPGTPYTPLIGTVNAVLGSGAMGVDLFFVLSGFLITGILFDSRADHAFFRKFYARRALRIFPLYYGVLGLFALGSLVLGWHYNHQLWSMALYLQNTHWITVPIYAYAGPSFLPLAHFWSLAIEEQFYLGWPLVVFLLGTRRRLLLCCAVCIALCPLLRIYLWTRGWGYFPVHVSTLTRADSLLSGAALALLLRGDGHDAVLRAARWVTLGGFAAFVATLAFAGPEPLTDIRAAAVASLQHTALGVLFSGVLAMALQPGRVAQVFRLRWMRFLGTYSYGLYVFHLPLFGYLQVPVRNLIRTHLVSNKAVSLVMTGLVCFALSTVLAWASFRFYESPFLRLKRYFEYKPVAQAIQSPV